MFVYVRVVCEFVDPGAAHAFCPRPANVLKDFPKATTFANAFFVHLLTLQRWPVSVFPQVNHFFLGTRRSTCTYVSSLGLYLLCLCLWQWPVQSNMTWGLSTCGQSFEFRCSCFGPWEQWHHDERTACLCAWLLWVSGWGLFFCIHWPMLCSQLNARGICAPFVWNSGLWHFVQADSETCWPARLFQTQLEELNQVAQGCEAALRYIAITFRQVLCFDFRSAISSWKLGH